MRLRILNSLIFSFFFINLSLLSGQDLSKYNKEKERLSREIELTGKLLNDTKEQQHNATQSVTLLSNQIVSRKNLVSSYSSQINEVNAQISKSDSLINALVVNIESTKSDYIKLIQDAYLRRQSFDLSLYILSSESFNQAYQRYRMINEINSYRKGQVKFLSQSSIILKNEREKLIYLKAQINELLNNVSYQSSTLEHEKKLMQKSITDLKGKEKKLIAELNEKKKQQQELESKIVELIKDLSAVKTYSLSDFDKNMGQLKWPVEESVVVSSFGEHEHPVLKGVMVKNNGIDLKLVEDLSVHSVFSGEVSRVIGIPGYNKAIIIRHGKYLTVYANMSEVTIKAGQKVVSGQRIGSVFSGEGDNCNVLHFEIWNENVKVNPLVWLKK